MRTSFLTFLLFLVLVTMGCTQRAPVGDDDTSWGDDDDTSWGDDDDTSASDDDDTSASDDDDSTSGDDDDTSSGDDDDSTPAPAFTVNCMPATQQLAITWGNPTTVQLSAEVIWPDGTVEAPTNATWSVENNFGGSVTIDGLYTTPSDHGGIGEIAVRQQGITGICEIEITIDGEINNTPENNLPGAFSQATVLADDSCAAQIIYPSDGAVMPGSLLPPKIQWTANAGSNMYSLHLRSLYSDLTFFTSDDHLTTDQGTWLGLTTFDPGTEVEITLTSGNWNGSSFTGDVCTAESTVTIEASDNDLDGTVVYWAPGIGGTMRAISIGAAAPTSFSLPAMSCVGCHTVNLSNPSLMSYADFAPTNPGRVVNLSNPSNIIAGPMDSLFTTLNPDGTRGIKAPPIDLLGAIFGTTRQLTLVELPSGLQLGTLPTSGTPAFADWSPDGTKVVYSSCSEGSTEFGGNDCDLRIMDVSGDVFSNDRLLLAQQGDENFYYPTFSPDSQWVAFNRGTTFYTEVQEEDVHGDPVVDSAGNPVMVPTATSTSNSNETAKLYIISANGGAAIEMAAASVESGLTNSWPRWAPVTQDYAWLAFSSKRAYGHTVHGPSQLWITAVDLSQASLGNDPSAPAVWLTGQSTSEDNLIPIWVPRIAF